MKSTAHRPQEERPHKRARVLHSAEASAFGQYMSIGMHAFKGGPFPTEGDEPESIRSAIVLYNTGLTQLGLEKYEIARKWFELAGVRLKLDTTVGASALLVRVIHNAGYCCYCLGDSEGAKNYFTAALKLARRAALEETNEASINICLGALCCNKEDLSS
jgi:tetratricopeptide (TPR) repeat protein